MRQCVWCMALVDSSTKWDNLFFPRKETVQLCTTCAMHLEHIGGDVCNKCYRLSDKEICDDCINWKQYYADADDPLSKNFSLFHYNDFVKDLITKWKYRGDYLLGEVFRENVKKFYSEKIRQTISGGVLAVPVPLSDSRAWDRAFNQAEQLATFLPVETENLLARVAGEKQSKKSRYERLSTKNPFLLQKTVNKPVLLVDDIYTTGRTLRHAAELLKESGCPHISALTLVRS